MGLVDFPDEDHIGLREKVTNISSVQNKEHEAESQPRMKHINVGHTEGPQYK